MKLFVLGMLLATFTAPAAQAQVSVDVSKITCEQFILFKVTDPRYIAIWLSGYYNGKRDNTVIDTQAMEGEGLLSHEPRRDSDEGGRNHVRNWQVASGMGACWGNFR
jgi:hypothetical protein